MPKEKHAEALESGLTKHVTHNSSGSKSSSALIIYLTEQKKKQN